MAAGKIQQEHFASWRSADSFRRRAPSAIREVLLYQKWDKLLEKNQSVTLLPATGSDAHLELVWFVEV
jgi:hypothetical protein